MGGFFGRVGEMAAIRKVLIGLFLILAFVATGAVLLFVLTAEQLQGAVASPDIAAFKPTIGSIRQYVAELERYYAIDDFVSSRQKEISSQILARSADEEAALAQMVTSADDVRAFVNTSNTLYIHPPLTLRPFSGLPPAAQTQPLQAPPQQTQPESAAPQDTAAQSSPQTGQSAPAQPAATPAHQRKARASASPPPESLGLQDALAAYFIEYYQQAAAQPGDAGTAAHKQIDEFKAQTFKPYQIYATARAKYDAAQSQLQSLKAQNDALQAQEDDYYNGIIADPSPLATDAFWNLCEDFLSFKSLVGDWAYNIVLFPKMMLVLILAIFMGILGSLIYISQDFLKNPDGRTFWDILFRIGLGAGVAFALFFFAAAGMLSLSQTSNGGPPEMSPYLISFLGITGGYLSDRVTEWMRQVGENTFKVDDGGPPKRWAMGLAAALSAAGLDSTALASAVGVPASEAADWASLTQPVPGDKQALVSAFLRTHPSKLFTDIAPG
ncbi:MAG: hypothetical protein ACREHE_14820 [Rhizomicrobium sp.]